jgi:hypothetical protein
VVFIVPIALGPTPAAAAGWMQRWFAPGQPWLAYPSAANLYWLGHAGLALPDPLVPEQISDALAERIALAFGLVEGYDMPAAEVDAFARVIRAGLGR